MSESEEKEKTARLGEEKRNICNVTSHFLL
jgi:hypothetical protein